MKVKELIKLLEKQDQDRIIVLASDSEGNSYNSFGGQIYPIHYNKADGEVGIGELTEELRKEGYDEDDVIKGKPALILYPD